MGDGYRGAVVIGYVAEEMTARLLAAPHLISPDWLKGGRDAVPFAAASPIPPVVAGRLAAAVRTRGERLVLGCPAVRWRSTEKAVAVQAEGARIHAAMQAIGTPEALIAVPDLSAALLTTGAGFAVAAGPRQFVEAVAGSDVRRARSSFAEFALAALGLSARSLAVAAYYGCALSGRPWRPTWLAWCRAADVPYGSGIGGQLAAMRQFAEGWIGADEFARMFRGARGQEIAAGERAAGPLSGALDAVGWALDGYVAADEELPSTAADIDLAGLRQAVSAALAEITQDIG